MLVVLRNRLDEEDIGNANDSFKSKVDKPIISLSYSSSMAGDIIKESILCVDIVPGQ